MRWLDVLLWTLVRCGGPSIVLRWSRGTPCAGKKPNVIPSCLLSAVATLPMIKLLN